MAQGLDVPIGVSGSGGARLINGDAQLVNTIFLALTDGENDNPFNDIGLLPDMIFALNSPQTRDDIRSNVENVFNRFARDLKAQLDNLVFLFESAEQQLVAQIAYINLETDRASEFGVAFSSDGSAILIL